jgi:hypothetical protein
MPRRWAPRTDKYDGTGTIARGHAFLDQAGGDRYFRSSGGTADFYLLCFSPEINQISQEKDGASHHARSCVIGARGPIHPP